MDYITWPPPILLVLLFAACVAFAVLFYIGNKP